MRPEPSFSVKQPLFRWSGKDAWYFIRVDAETSRQIALVGAKRGWGSVKVSVTIDDLIWKTSVFPDKDGTYLLPVKAAVRKQKALVENEVVEFSLRLVD